MIGDDQGMSYVSILDRYRNRYDVYVFSWPSFVSKRFPTCVNNFIFVICSPLFVLMVGGLQLLPRTSDGIEEGSADQRKMLIEKKKIVKE